VIHEILYHPTEAMVGMDLVENLDEEYIELRNLSEAAVPLYDPAQPSNRWQLSEAVQFVFPENVVLEAGGYLLVVHFDPIADPIALAQFQAKYGLGPGLPIYGPYVGG